MPPLDLGKFAPVTLGHMRSQGCRDLLACCNSGRCNHSTIMNGGHLSGDNPIKSLGKGIVCARCGHVGADVMPNWPAQYDTSMRNFISRAGILLRGSSRNSTFDLPDRLSSRHLLDTPVANIGEHGAGASALGLAFGPSLGALEYGGVCNLEYSS